MSDTLIEKALDAAGFAVLVLDEIDQIVEVSSPAARLLGFDPVELRGEPVSAFLPMASIKPLVLDTMAHGVPGAVIDIVARNRSGQEIPVAVSAVAWKEPDGKCFTTVFIRNFAEEKEVARLAQNQLVLSDNAIRGANIGVFEYDPIADTVTVSDIWRQMLELGVNEIVDVQHEWQCRVHPDDLEAALDPIRLCSQGHTERATCEYRLHSRDRSHWRWMRTDIAVARRDAMGRPSLLVGAQTDITERKLTEEALRVSVEQFRSAFDSGPIGKALIDLHGNWLLVNPAMCELLGYSESELRKTNFQALTHPDDLEADLRLLKLLIAGQIPSYTIDKRYYRFNGAIMWGRLSVGMVRDAEGRPDHFVSQVIDITEQRRLEEVRSEFVSVVSHELRTPLTSILGALTLLSTYDEDQFTDEVQRLLFIARANGERLQSLVNDILDFQKFSAQQMRFSPSPQRIAKLVEDSLMTNLASADKFGVRFSPQIRDRTLLGMTDPKRFQQVMANLLSNATKFAKTGSAVEVNVDQIDQSIRVSVTNVGEGIPEAFRERVFKPFSQAIAMSDRRSGGTGLGLSITKQIVEQMGGEIGFDSTPGEKTTFWFTVPSAGH